MTVNPQTLKRLGFTKDLTCNNIDQFTFNRNGLKVVLSADELSSVVSFVILYKVGSRNEAVGYTGSTHFLEHLMFKDTKNHKAENGTGFDSVFKPLGNMVNANTWFDRTMYYECVPADKLEICVEFEADRMRNLLLTQSDHDSEMTVVRNELERGETEPNEMMTNQVFATIFREHPYHHPTIGWRSDVEGMPLSRLKQFHEEFYWPNNATIFILGNFDELHALKLVNKYFGKIKTSPKAIPEVYTTEPNQVGERRFELFTNTQLPQLTVAYRVPNAVSEETAKLSVLDILMGNSSMPNSLLYKALIKTGLCVQAASSFMPLKDYGVFSIDATISPSSNINEVEQAILTLIDALRTSTDAKTNDSTYRNEVLALFSQSQIGKLVNVEKKRQILGTLDPLHTAENLAEWEGKSSWTDFYNLVGRMEKVTVDDLKELLNTYFVKSNRTVGHLFSSEKLDDSPITPVVYDEANEPPINNPNRRSSVVTETSDTGSKE